MKTVFVILAAAAAAAFAAVPAMATGTEPVQIYPYASAQNYCPEGLRPVSFNGVISCGKPTTSITYQQVMRHAGSSSRLHVRYDDCRPGAKGCGG